MNKKILGIRKGFTLAEVLITLGIIGVVAAMTIPTLIQNTNSVKFQSQFKKSISTLSQAALMAQAQHDIDYSLLSAASTDDDCQSDSLHSNKLTMCGLFNSTLAGQTYLGLYEDIADSSGNKRNDTSGGAQDNGQGYRIELASGSGFNPAGYMVFSLADGSFVGFNKAAKECHLAPGNPITEALLTAGSGSGSNATAGGALSNCMGFIDVNGVTSPNEEVTCADGSAKLGAASSDACTLSATGRAVGDVFPIVFHDGTVEPATNAARAALTRAK